MQHPAPTRLLLPRPHPLPLPLPLRPLVQMCLTFNQDLRIQNRIKTNKREMTGRYLKLRINQQGTTEIFNLYEKRAFSSFVKDGLKKLKELEKTLCLERYLIGVLA